MQKTLTALFLLLATALNFSGQINECDADRVQNAVEKEIASVPDPGKTFRIPVIVHVVYNTTAENVSTARIRAMLESLQDDFLAENADYATIPADFRELAGNPRIRFELATEIDGKPVTGIIRRKTKYKIFSKAAGTRYKMFDESKIIDGSRFLNIYICDYQANGVAGFSGKKRDGIVVDYLRVNGTSRTATHETGHWLGLSHVWRFSVRNRPGCGDDKLSDTPISRKHAIGRRYTHPLGECGQRAVAFQNFLDYSSFRAFFTDQQIDRMRQKILTRKPGIGTIN